MCEPLEKTATGCHRSRMFDRCTSQIIGLAAILLGLTTTAIAQLGDVSRVHDPCIAKCGDSYYIFSTGRGGMPMHKSRDLVTWREIGRVFSEIPAWAKEAIPGARDIWAPDISFYNGAYHLYYSVSTFGSQTSRIGLATNKTLDPESPDYRWIDKGEVIASSPESDFNAIDPNLVVDDDGKPWLTWGSFWNGIKLCRVNPITGKPFVGEPFRSLASRDGAGIEAPFIVKKGKFWYLFVSFEQCCQGVRSTYNTRVGRSVALTGPYVDREGTPMMQGGGTVVIESYGSVRGPGHNAVLLDKTGDYLVHHFYDAESSGVATLHIRPMLWAQDGWPLAGEPIPMGRPVQELSALGKWKHYAGSDTEADLDLLPGGKVAEPFGGVTWSLKGNNLTLRFPKDDSADGDAWIDQCIISPDGRWYTGRNQDGVVVRGVRM